MTARVIQLIKLIKLIDSIVGSVENDPSLHLGQ